MVHRPAQSWTLGSGWVRVRHDADTLAGEDGQSVRVNSLLRAEHGNGEVRTRRVRFENEVQGREQIGSAFAEHERGIVRARPDSKGPGCPRAIVKNHTANLRGGSD